MTGDDGKRSDLAPLPADRREQLALLSRTLEREAHILVREPEVLASHLHNTLYLDEGDEGPAGPLLVHARDALADRPWLRLTNRPPVERSALIRVLKHRGRVLALAWSPEGSLLASGSSDNTVRLWDPATGRLEAVLEGHTDQVFALAWSPDGALLASGSSDNTVRVWDPATGRLKTVLEGHAADVVALAWSKDGLLASGGWDNSVRLWEPATGSRGDVLEGHTDSVMGLAWTPDGALLASGSLDNSVRLWEPTAGKALAVLKGHSDWVFAVAWSSDGRTLASASEDFTVRLWDAATREARSTLLGHAEPVKALAWSPDGATLASGSFDATVRLWRRPAGTQRAALQGHAYPVFCLAWSPSGAVLASGDLGRPVSDMVKGRRSTGVSSMAVGKATVRLWDAPTGRAVAVLEGHSDVVDALAWSPSGALLASGSFDSTVRVWDATGGQLAAVIEGQTGPVNALVWSPDGATLASGGADGRVRLWDPAISWLRRVVEGQTGAVWCLGWSPDGTLLASGGENRTVRLCNLTQGISDAVLEGHTGRILALAWSPDGALLASGGQDHSARLWDVATGKQAAVLEGHAHWVRVLAWSPDGRLVASGGRDNSVRLWDPVTGACFLVAHCLSPVLGLQFSDDCRILRAADDGAATGNRPIPYVFELCNVEVGPPVAPSVPSPPRRVAEPAAGTAKRAVRPKKPAVKTPGRKTGAAPERAPRPPRKEESMPAAPSMTELLESSGLKYVDLGGGALAVPFRAERADQLVIQVKKLGDDVAFFVVSLPKPGWLSQEGALRNLLQVSFRANYVKALAFDSGELGLAVELPEAVLTPGVVEGVIRGLSHLGDVKGGDLGKWDGWERRLIECTLAQARRFKVGVEEAGKEIRGLAERAGLRWREVEKDTLVVEWEVVGTDLELVIHPREAVISSIVYLGGVKPKGDKKKYMRSLLELNRKVNVAKAGLDSDGDVALLYEVPQVLPDLLDTARAQVERLFLGVVALEAGRSL